MARTALGVLLLGPWMLFSDAGLAQSVRVRHTEGLVHGFLIVRSTAGAHLADGDLLQTSNGTRVTSRLVFRFTDGSLQDETSVFSQARAFQLLSYHLIQKGRSFPRSLDLTINRGAGRVVARYTDDGKEKVEEEKMELPANLANGMIPLLLKNIRAGDLPLTLSMVAATPKPRLVDLHVSSAGETSFSTGSTSRKAIEYVIKVDVGGLSGLLAPLVGKQPPDSRVWILPGAVPAFVRSESPFFAGGALWRIELTSPVWKKAA
jgi:hypothetical protein